MPVDSSEPRTPVAAVAITSEQRSGGQRRRWCLPPANRRTYERSSDRAVRFPVSRTFVGTLALAVSAATIVAACGDHATSTRDLSVAGRRGEALVINRGCQACHGVEWTGGVGPTLVGLAGSTVTLDDGTTVTADSAYLSTAISDPTAQKVKGYAIVMPKNDLTPDQVADVVAFIQELGPTSP